MRSKANSHPPSKMLTARPIVDICPTGAYKREKTGASYGDGSSSRSGATWVSSVLKGTFVSVEELIGEVGEDVEEDDDDDIVEAPRCPFNERSSFKQRPYCFLL